LKIEPSRKEGLTPSWVDQIDSQQFDR
jgi:hypothetical protein